MMKGHAEIPGWIVPKVENRDKEDKAMDLEIRNQRAYSSHGFGVVSP